MKSCSWICVVFCALGSVVLTSCAGVGNSQTAPPPPGQYQLTVSIPTSNSGTVTSSPAGINCPTTCSANFAQNTQVTLTASASSNYSFTGWSGGCTGSSTCTVTITADTSVSAAFTQNTGTIKVLNHIILVTQENRSFDEYFGYMRQYWANNGIPDQQFDGLPQFTPASQCTTTNGVNSCAVPTNPPCSSATGHCVADPNGTPVPSFHIGSVCTEDTSPFWNESHVAWNTVYDGGGDATTPWLGNGFVQETANEIRAAGGNDTNGYRSMGYLTDQELNYYYFMATNFATSDRWFAPVMSRTQLNRAYILSGTSQGYIYPPGENPPLDSAPFSATTIFQALQNAGITWRVYGDPAGCPQGETGAALNKCLAQNSYINMFSWESQVQSDPSLYQNFVPNTQFASDVQNEATLPQVLYFDPPSFSGQDEHPSDNDTYTVDIQAGAAHVASIINALMTSPSWKDSALIFSYDEPGGFYDHVQPQTVPVPDKYSYPIDLGPNDACNGVDATSGICSFGMTSYRVPLIIVSPYAKKNYVSHTVRDTTAWLSLVEERFGITPLTARDGYWLTETDSTTGLPGKMDEFFDFSNPPWMTPPTPPTQNQGASCNFNEPNPWGGN